MEIIPVIDIRHGLAVHAVRGERSRYKPIETVHARSADPIDVARGLAALFPFETLYVADLDGIEGRGMETDLQRRLVAAWPGASVWIDDGAHRPPSRSSAIHHEKRVTVVGSETLPPSLPRPRASVRTRSEGWLADIGWGHRDDWILSLDFHDEDLLGPEWLLEEPSTWPSQVIAMTVRRVGTGAGADLKTVERIAKIAEASRVYAAGGVRDRRDLEALRDVGATGALVATALHAGTLMVRDIEQLAAL
jgi:phosphoribosylformimino-5-aminoimidazole carboxamide ribotide isomerase